MNPTDDMRGALLPVIDAFSLVGAPYYIGGSVASGAFGEFRATNDVDVIVDLRQEHAEPFVKALGDAYFADLDSVRVAIQRRSSFNIIHLATMLKVDVFVLRTRPYDQEALRRRVTKRLSDSPDSPTVELASPEDTVIAKLDWYRQGGEVSERQWRDIQGVLRIQSTALDIAYLREWAGALGLTDLLDRALAEGKLG